MMKKFVVLTLLLAMASLATAGLEVVVDQDDAAKTGIITLTGSNMFGILVAIDAQGTDVVLDFSNITFPTAFDLPGKAQGVTAQYGEVTISNIFGMPKDGDMVAGIGYDFSAVTSEQKILVTALTGTSEGMGGGNPIPGLLAEIVVPEPMTFALLGLGGLFLRRRK